MIAKRLLILTTTTGYQTRAFVEAAQKLGLAVVFGSDRCHVLEDPWQDGALPLRFEDPERSAQQIADFARSNAVDAIVSLGDRPTPTAAQACRALGLPYHPPQAADACRDKHRSRELLHSAGLNVPAYRRFPLDADPRAIVSGAPRTALTEPRDEARGQGLPLQVELNRLIQDTRKGEEPGGWRPPLQGDTSGVGFPCVLKPLALSGSRGVIRADNSEQFVPAFERIRALLRSPEVQVMREETSHFIQVEDYIEGQEVAVEALVDRGRLRVLAMFDKPDRLVGPFFEETIYVTPSRLAPQVQASVTHALERAVQALGLFHGPLHAEFRINAGSVWVLEVAARSIGGLCSRALRFCSPSPGEGISLEELIIRLALSEEVQSINREAPASGVMMIPIPEAGIYQSVEGVDEALETPGVEDIHITAKPTEKLVPLPEGSSYLGFIFVRGSSPEFVEEALRGAHRKLRLVMGPVLPVIQGSGILG